MTLAELKKDLEAWENSSCFMNQTLWISENMVDPLKLAHRIKLAPFDFEEIREYAIQKLKSLIILKEKEIENMRSNPIFT